MAPETGQTELAAYLRHRGRHSAARRGAAERREECRDEAADGVAAHRRECVIRNMPRGLGDLSITEEVHARDRLGGGLAQRSQRQCAAHAQIIETRCRWR